MNGETLLYQMTETSVYLMGFVLVTKSDNVIVIDGGRPEDMPHLKELIGGRHISAWILTHAHTDHISGLVDEIKKNGGQDFDIEAIYYNFPPYERLKGLTEVPDLKYFNDDLDEMLPAFNEIYPLIADKCRVVEQGDSFTVDECKIEVIYSFHDGLYSNPINDSSLVFKITAPNKTVLFLGDLGPEGGDVLFEESRDKLKADIVQMAHHGHMCVGMEIYAAVAPEACLWCCPDWLYNEPEIPKYLKDREKLKRMKRTRMFGVALTRRWMDILGVKTHYVSKDGPNKIIL